MHVACLAFVAVVAVAGARPDDARPIRLISENQTVHTGVAQPALGPGPFKIIHNGACYKSAGSNVPLLRATPTGTDCTSFYKYPASVDWTGRKSLRLNSASNSQTLDYFVTHNPRVFGSYTYHGGSHQLFTYAGGTRVCLSSTPSLCFDLQPLNPPAGPTTTTYTGTTTTTTQGPTTKPKPAFWVKGPVGDNCLYVCLQRTGTACVENQWPANKAYFDKEVLGDIGDKSCSSVEDGDWDVNPGQYADYGNVCYWAYGTSNQQNQAILASPRCNRVSSGVARFCPCLGPVIATTTTTTTTEMPTTTVPTPTTLPPTKPPPANNPRTPAPPGASDPAVPATRRRSGKSSRRRNARRRRRSKGGTTRRRNKKTRRRRAKKTTPSKGAGTGKPSKGAGKGQKPSKGAGKGEKPSKGSGKGQKPAKGQ